MSNIIPSKPSFVFGYWRPWKENSDLFDSYLDYRIDTSLVKYGADTVGSYINQASKEQVKAINQLGQAIGRGMDVLSNQMSDINETLVFLNRNMDIQVEQQKLSNLLLQNIAELLRVPDSEKERQHSIELGIKFFVNASKDADLYADALEELLKAESLMKQDYFVLNRIGCIYLYVEKYINPAKALEYFLRAGKYASVESDSNAMRFVNVLTNNFNKINSETKGENFTDVTDMFKSGNKLGAIKLLKDKTGWDLKECQDWMDNKINEGQNSLNHIGLLAADSFEKAAFAAYVLGRFTDALNFQEKALKFNNTSQNRFLLAKYQVRNKRIAESIQNLEIAFDENPNLLIGTFKDLDLISEQEVLNLIEKKNNLINAKIKFLIEVVSVVDDKKTKNIINTLNELLSESYEIKIFQYLKLESSKSIVAILKSNITRQNSVNEKQPKYVKLLKENKELFQNYNELLSILKNQIDNETSNVTSKKSTIFKEIDTAISLNKVLNEYISKIELNSELFENPEEIKNMLLGLNSYSIQQREKKIIELTEQISNTINTKPISNSIHTKPISNSIDTNMNEGSVSDKRCYIATATFGTDDHYIINDLRRFRDEHLIYLPLGRKFITFYYRFSPYISKIIANSICLKFISLYILIKPTHYLILNFLNKQTKR